MIIIKYKKSIFVYISEQKTLEAHIAFDSYI